MQQPGTLSKGNINAASGADFGQPQLNPRESF